MVRLAFNLLDDILLLQEIERVIPWACGRKVMEAWGEIAHHLNTNIQSSLNGLKATNCRARFYRLLEHQRDKKYDALKKGGTSQEFLQKVELLERVVTLMGTSQSVATVSKPSISTQPTLERTATPIAKDAHNKTTTVLHTSSGTAQPNPEAIPPQQFSTLESVEAAGENQHFGSAQRIKQKPIPSTTSEKPPSVEKGTQQQAMMISTATSITPFEDLPSVQMGTQQQTMMKLEATSSAPFENPPPVQLGSQQKTMMRLKATSSTPSATPPHVQIGTQQPMMMAQNLMAPTISPSVEPVARNMPGEAVFGLEVSPPIRPPLLVGPSHLVKRKKPEAHKVVQAHIQEDDASDSSDIVLSGMATDTAKKSKTENVESNYSWTDNSSCSMESQPLLSFNAAIGEDISLKVEDTKATSSWLQLAERSLEFLSKQMEMQRSSDAAERALRREELLFHQQEASAHRDQMQQLINVLINRK